MRFPFWLLFEDDDESFVVVGDEDDNGMLDFSVWLPKFGFNISEIKNDFIFDVCFLFNNIGDVDDDDTDDDLEYAESGEDRYSWWSLAPMIKTLFRFWQL